MSTDGRSQGIAIGRGWSRARCRLGCGAVGLRALRIRLRGRGTVRPRCCPWRRDGCGCLRPCAWRIAGRHDRGRVLEGLGFEHRGELGIPQRWAFWEPDRLIGTNTYVVVAGSLALRNHLAVRDLLRADGVLRAEYRAVKKEVAATAADIFEYGARTTSCTAFSKRQGYPTQSGSPSTPIKYR